MTIVGFSGFTKDDSPGASLRNYHLHTSILTREEKPAGEWTDWITIVDPLKIGIDGGKPIYHDNVMIVGFDKFRKKEIHLFKEKFEEVDLLAKKHNGPKILVLHQAITDINKFAGEVNSADLPRNFTYYAMGHLHERFEKKFHHLGGPVVYPGSIELTSSEGIKETEKGFFEVEISETQAIPHWVPLNIRPQISTSIEISELDEALANLSEKIHLCKRKPIVEIKIHGKNVDYDLVEAKISALTSEALHFSWKVDIEEEQSHKIFSEKPSIDAELLKLAIKHLENEELADFATNELLPTFENDELDVATQLVIKDYDDFRRKKT